MGIKKELRLKSKKSLGELASKGNRIKAFPVHLKYRLAEFEVHDQHKKFQIAFSAPKRIHRSAVKRNRLKRLMREAFRPFIPQLDEFMENNERRLDIMLIYVGPEEQSQVAIGGKIKVLFSRLEEDYKSHDTDE